LRWLSKHSLPLLPLQLELGNISGKLIGPIHIEQLRYHDNQQTIELQHAYLDWKPSELIHQMIHVTHLSAQNISITSHEKADSIVANPRTNIQNFLPSKLTIQLDEVSVNKLTITTKNSQIPMIFQDLLLSAAWDKSILKLSHSRVQTPWFTAHLHGQYDSIQSHVDAQFSWSREINEALRVFAKGSLYGSLANLTLTQHSQAPIDTTIVANLKNLLNQPSWKITLTAPSFDLITLNPKWPNATVDAKFSLQGKSILNQTNRST